MRDYLKEGTVFTASRHAVQRFRERFAGNLSESAAQCRLEKIALRAHYVKNVPGHAKLYVTKYVALIVRDRLILTVVPWSARTCISQSLSRATSPWETEVPGSIRNL